LAAEKLDIHYRQLIVFAPKFPIKSEPICFGTKRLAFDGKASVVINPGTDQFLFLLGEDFNVAKKTRLV
jgi:hypothetical protein